MKLSLLVLVVVIFGSCKEKENSRNIVVTDDNFCEIYNSIPKDSLQLKYALLVVNQKNYCNGNLNGCILQNHEISEKIYNEKLDNNSLFDKGEKKINFQDLKRIFINGQCLVDYVGFEIDTNSNSISKIKLVKFNFNHKNRYSIPLFNSLEKKYSLSNKDTIVFSLGKDDATHKDYEVVFKIIKSNGTTLGFADVTIDPSNKIDFARFGLSNPKLPSKYSFKSE
jgi:hypothetical protein